MRKWLLLFGGLAILVGNVWGIYSMYQPRVGPIGNGKIADQVWVSISISSLTGLFVIAQSVVFFLYDNHKKRFPRLETERFLLRPIEISDAKEVYHYFSQDEVTKYYDLNTFKDIREAKVLIETGKSDTIKKRGFAGELLRRKTIKLLVAVVITIGRRNILKQKLVLK